MQQKEAAKKQAASAAAAAAAVSGRMIHGKPIHDSLGTTCKVLAQTASWLDRANAILSQTHSSQSCRRNKSTIDDQEIKISKSSSSDEVEKELKEVEQLIHEGPITSAGLSTMLQNENPTNTTSSSNDTSTKRKVSDDDKADRCASMQSTTSIYDDHFQQLEPSIQQDNFSSQKSNFYDKRIRRSFSHNNIQDHEDAGAFLGFLSSVHQAAASSSSTPSK